MVAKKPKKRSRVGESRERQNGVRGWEEKNKIRGKGFEKEVFINCAA